MTVNSNLLNILNIEVYVRGPNNQFLGQRLGKLVLYQYGVDIFMALTIHKNYYPSFQTDMVVINLDRRKFCARFLNDRYLI